MPLNFSVLGSGSSGNCAYVAGNRGAVLLDCGLSERETAKRLRAVAPGARVDAIVIGHEHLDHAGTAADVATALRIPVWATAGTAEALRPKWGSLMDLNFSSPRLGLLAAGQAIEIGDLVITPFAVPHDAAEPIGFVVESQGLRLVYALDLGEIAPVLGHLHGDALILEANHDVDMLAQSEYPAEVKRRISGSTGHLSNDAVEAFLANDWDGGARVLVLAHLSRHCNYPAYVDLVAKRALAKRELSPRLEISRFSRPTELIEL